MRVKRFEAYLKELLVKDDHEEVVGVETFDEAGYDSKPVGLKIQFASGARVFIQFVRTAPPGGDDHSLPEYVITKELQDG